MGIESILGVCGRAVCGCSGCGVGYTGAERPQVEGCAVAMVPILLGMAGVDGCWRRRGARVPKHAAASRLNTAYEVSTRWFRSTDLRRIC